MALDASGISNPGRVEINVTRPVMDDAVVSTDPPDASSIWSIARAAELTRSSLPSATLNEMEIEITSKILERKSIMVQSPNT